MKRLLWPPFLYYHYTSFTKKAGIQVETRDISLAARVLSQFPDALSPEQKQSDDLSELGELAKLPEEYYQAAKYICIYSPTESVY